MERDYNRHYYHGGLGAEDNLRDFDRDTRDGDFGRDYENRYRGRKNYYDRDDRNYRHRDFDMERNYYENVGNSGHNLDDIRQGYGYPSFDQHPEDYRDTRDELHDMMRERNRQQSQGYGSGRLSGYSGSAFGGANYSSHGEFGGSPRYGSMSGRGANPDRYASWSGYSSGYDNRPPYNDENRNRGYGRTKGRNYRDW